MVYCLFSNESSTPPASAEDKQRSLEEEEKGEEEEEKGEEKEEEEGEDKIVSICVAIKIYNLKRIYKD